MTHDQPTRDQMIGENLAKARGEMSQQFLADKMRALGFEWAQATVWSVEKGKRAMRLAEAEALAKIMDIRVEDLLERPKWKMFEDLAEQVDQAATDMKMAAIRWENHVRWLAQEADLQLHEGYAIPPTIENMLSSHGYFRFDLLAHEYLALFDQGRPPQDVFGPYTKLYASRSGDAANGEPSATS